MSNNYKELEDYQSFTKPAEVHKAVNSLIGILEGIKLDSVVNTLELEEVIHWCSLQRKFQNKFPFSEIIPMIDLALVDGVITEEEIEDILWLCKNVVHQDGFNMYYNVVTSSLQELQGIIHGVMADNVLTEQEITKMFSWMNDHEFLKGYYPFDEIYSLLISIKEDGIISDDEKNMLRAYFSHFIDTRSSYNINEIEMKELQSKYSVTGICVVDPQIIFEGRTFSFTGTSSKAKRSEIAELITNNGGIFNNNVTQQTDYLIVGNDGNPCWAFSCYGRKVEKAVDLRKNGSSILIVHENDFWDGVW
ncbi:BRCT domain-containing protein [Ureibacillus sp. MALMAid1270]|uniref:BRCT domain-containing protein n=1 Tax=Ureibacillus sp. MALMAid1270 TaxID=3411629 RepID=UPI003BA81378